MIDFLLEPFSYSYMSQAIWVCALVGGICAFLSCFLILKGWSLMGDALAHSIVPGVALAYIFALPYALGAFFAGGLAALSMMIVKQTTRLREDTTIGLIFTTFFAAGLLLASLRPMAVDLQSIILGNILAISGSDALQLVIIVLICAVILLCKWRDFLLLFFDEAQAHSLGLRVGLLKVIFFTLLSVASVAALQTVGACLVVAMVITPGAIAYLLTDRFGVMLWIAVLFGALSAAFGTYLSYFLDVNPGGLIVSMQTGLFLLTLTLAPKYGLLRRYKNLRVVEV